MSIGKRNKDHLRKHARVVEVEMAVPPRSDDQLVFWTGHTHEDTRVDLHIFAEGESVAPTNSKSWGGSYSGRPKLIREMAPSIQARLSLLSKGSVSGYMQALRAFWRLFDEIERETETGSDGKKLKNLVEALGAVFRTILIDQDRSERRIFSILLNDEPSDEANEIIKLGVLLGYFHEASIGAKDGLGRTKRVVLTRRLAPYFNLDPIGFSGYLSVTRRFLDLALHHPDQVRGRVRREGIDSFTQQPQLEFDLEGGSL